MFFFDEAHLLFDDMPKRLGDKIVQVVKLIRSKGVGVYFITQSPSDVPGEVLAQLSNRVQHGLRAYTPAEQKVVRAAAASFRANPSFDSAAALQEIGTGEALVSFLDEKGTPSVVESARVLFPQCKMDAADPEVLRGAVTAQSDLMGKYGTAIDRQSAFEDINGMKAEEAESQRLAAERVELERERAEFEKERAKVAEREEKERQKAAEKAERAQEREMERQRKELERQQRTLERQQERRDAQIRRTAGSILGAIGREASRQLVRGIFGTLRL